MAEATGMTYVALRDIPARGDTSAFAFRTGDLVHESAVDGDDAWLVLGDDVKIRPGAAIPMPRLSATQTAWAEYAVSRGSARDVAEGMTRTDLIKEYGARDGA